MKRAIVFALSFVGCRIYYDPGDGNTLGDGAALVDGGGDQFTGCPPGGMATQLATGQTSAACGPRLALDGENVYWLAGTPMGGVLRKVPKAGGATTDLAATMGKPMCDLALDATSAYFTTGIDDEIERVALAGGAAAAIVSAQAFDTEYDDLAVDGTNVYWTERTGSTYPIEFAPLGMNAPMNLSTQPELLTGFVLVGANLIGTDPGPAADPAACMIKGICNYPSGRIVAVAKTGGPPTALYANARNLPALPNAPSGIATDGTDLYWLQAANVDANVHRNGDGTVMRAPSTGNGAPLALGTGFNQPTALAVDAASVWFTADNHVWKVAKSGGTATPIATGAGAIAVDDTSIYWFDGATVTRACK